MVVQRKLRDCRGQLDASIGEALRQVASVSRLGEAQLRELEMQHRIVSAWQLEHHALASRANHVER